MGNYINVFMRKLRMKSQKNVKNKNRNLKVLSKKTKLEHKFNY